MRLKMFGSRNAGWLVAALSVTGCVAAPPPAPAGAEPDAAISANGSAGEDAMAPPSTVDGGDAGSPGASSGAPTPSAKPSASSSGTGRPVPTSATASATAVVAPPDAGDGGIVPEVGTTLEGAIGGTGGSLATTGLVVNFPAGALDAEVHVVVEVRTSDVEVGSIGSVGSVHVDLGGEILNTPATVRLAIEPAASGEMQEPVSVIAQTGNGSFEVPASVETTEEGTFVVFTVVQGGTFTAVQVVPPQGCDTLVAKPALYATTTAQLADLSGVTRVTGALNLTGAGITSVTALQCLVRVDGDLVINQTALEDIGGLRNLTFVGGLLTIYNNGALATVNLPSLLNVGKQVSVQYNGVLEELSMDALGIVQGTLSFFSNGGSATGTTASFGALDSVTGDLMIQSNGRLESLGGFQSLDRVSGTVDIRTNNALTNLNGLGSLDEIGGNLIVYNNPGLEGALGLVNLSSVGGYLTVETNTLLEAAEFPALTDLGSHLRIYDNDNLGLLSANELEVIPGDLALMYTGNGASELLVSLEKLGRVGGNLSIQNNPTLEDLAGWEALKSVGGTVDVRGNNALSSGNGLAALKTVGGSYVFYLNPLLSALNGLALEDVGGSLTIQSNAQLGSFEADELATVDQQVYVYDNPKLASFVAGALTTVPGTLTFSNNGSAAQVTTASFPALERVGGDLLIQNNQALVDVNGLAALESTGSRIDIRGNAKLVDLDGLVSLQRIGAGGLTIYSNPELKSLDGLVALESVTGTLNIQANAKLGSIVWPLFDTLVGGDVYLYDNAALARVQMDALQAAPSHFTFAYNGDTVTSTTIGFAGLQTVAGGFNLSYDISVQSLAGFSQLASIGGGFSVSYNTLLPTCAAVALRDQVLSLSGISGQPITITNNAVDGCIP